ncbi:uncharacterized protein N7482_005330 [Penicillium canariense]|uniref:Uncharacterized protein n=1 Tax=Penicillium canariense TaxID=189055 RepID=A0A9W9I4P3_9EURO|nr:uncharacterized protein N7482_005330 [Penicillium canariense]KAJ5166549.1 hypothetical protein N7482_005330 [Penicillium canariense]
MARSDEKSHGRKRPAEGDPDGAQPLAKRFGRLQIDNEAPISEARAQPAGCPSPAFPAQADAMLLDDTKHTIYIHDLDRELAEPETPGGLVLLPIAAKMISMPESVLSASSPGKELVLYTEPSSLTLPKEQDSVRKAIIESRARARAGRHQSPPPPTESSPSSSNGFPVTTVTYSNDDDPMDIDFNP